MGQHFFHPAFQFLADQLFHRDTSQLEKQEGIFVDAHTHAVEYSGCMFAQNGVVGAAAADMEFPAPGVKKKSRGCVRAFIDRTPLYCR